MWRTFHRSSKSFISCIHSSLHTYPRGLHRTQAGLGNYNVGDAIGQFTISNITALPAYNVHALHCIHPSGAELIHIDTEDTNNVFSINFRTPPTTSSGVSHVLEHTVLCGSQKYPVRDPFFNMLKRSLNTYMNALTASDHTMYPYATTNVQDWKNLRQVYLDATFFPHLRLQDFRQEGIRISETTNETNSSTINETNCALEFKGIVYNEMKGACADHGSVLHSALSEHLFPDSTYGVVSGGHPRDIPSLSHTQLLDFHQAHYIPSNTLFFSYGDLPFEEHLQVIEEHVLNKMENTSTKKAVKIGARSSLDSAKRNATFEVSCAPDMEDNLLQYCTSMVVGDARDVYGSLKFRMLSYLLFNGPASPMYQNLLASNLATDFSSAAGFDGSTLETTFGMGVAGLSEDNLDAVKVAMETTLQQVAQDGFAQDRVDALLHQIELGQKHIVGAFGLNLMHAITSAWTHHSEDPVAALQVNSLLRQLRKEMENDPSFWQNQVKEHLLHNTERISVLLRPSVDFPDREKATELEKLLALEKSTDFEALRVLNSELADVQGQAEDVECLPTLTISDIPSTIMVDTPVEQAAVKGTPVQWNLPSTTNEVTYLRGKFNLHGLPSELEPYVGLFTSTFAALGAGTMNHEELTTYMESISGGLSASSIMVPKLDSTDYVQDELVVEVMCLHRNVSTTLQLLTQVCTETQYTKNLDVLAQLIDMQWNGAMQSISSSGHSLARSVASSKLTGLAAKKEENEGFTQLRFLKTLVRDMKNVQENKDSVYNLDVMLNIAKKLDAIAIFAFQQSPHAWSIVTEDSQVTKIEQHLETILPHFTTKRQTMEMETLPTPNHSSDEYIAVPLAVHFVARCFPTVPFAHKDHAPLVMAAQVRALLF